MHRVVVLLTGAALGFVSIATAIGFIIDAPHLLLLQRRHAETNGHVVRVIPNSHGLVQIRYCVGGTSYTRDVPGFGVFGPLAEGGLLRIYYDPKNPSIAFAAPAGEILAGQLPSWIVGSLLGSLFGFGVALNISRYTDRRNGRSS